MDTFTYDATRFERLVKEMGDKGWRTALRNALRREGNRVRKTAVEGMRKKLHPVSPGLEKGIRTEVYKRVAGFKVTVKPKGKKGYHRNRRGKEKPVLIWAEEGTQRRYTKDAVRYQRKRKSHDTGSMPQFGFMRDALRHEEGLVTENLKREVVKSVEQVAKKYGCN